MVIFEKRFLKINAWAGDVASQGRQVFSPPLIHTINQMRFATFARVRLLGNTLPERCSMLPIWVNVKRTHSEQPIKQRKDAQ